jgi:hypothetical protein
MIIFIFTTFQYHHYYIASQHHLHHHHYHLLLESALKLIEHNSQLRSIIEKVVVIGELVNAVGFCRVMEGFYRMMSDFY